jgi:transcriptional antiterminator RfaH
MPTALEIERGLRWYAIRTKPRKEAEVECRLSRLDLEVFLPWLRARRRVGTRFQWVLTPLFPGYLFSRLDMQVSGKRARYLPGVVDFLKLGSRIAEVEVEVIQGLRERCPNGVAQMQPRRYKLGEQVNVLEGPFSGLEAVFEREMKGSDRVAVLVGILGQQTRLILSSEMISCV